MRDYSQAGDTYGIASEYTSQSAHSPSEYAPKGNSGETFYVRGNAVLKPRGIPTQKECDAIKGLR